MRLNKKENRSETNRGGFAVSKFSFRRWMRPFSQCCQNSLQQIVKVVKSPEMRVGFDHCRRGVEEEACLAGVEHFQVIVAVSDSDPYFSAKSK